MKHYKLVEFLSNLNIKTPVRERKPPIDDFLETVLYAHTEVSKGEG